MASVRSIKSITEVEIVEMNNVWDPRLSVIGTLFDEL